MTEIPEIPLEQIQQRVVAMWMGSFYGSSGYVARKLGRKGLKEFYDLGAKQVAATFKKIGLDESKEIAFAIATNDKNLFGSIVEVAEIDGLIEIKRTKCGLREGTKTFAKIGASLITKEHCKTCSEAHWKKVLHEMGMEMETEYTENGCIMRIAKK